VSQWRFIINHSSPSEVGINPLAASLQLKISAREFLCNQQISMN
jgi:hypothetical protein